MAVELASGYVSIIPSAKGFAGKLGRDITPGLTSAGASAGSSAASSFGSSFTSKMADIGKKAALGLGVGLAAAGGFGIKVAADFEQTTIAFQGILGSADKATKVLGDLREFANRTPFEFPGLAKAAQQLLGVGFAAEEIIPIMSTIGDVTAALGVGQPAIDGVVRALGQMRGKGKASAQELNQISEQIPGFSAVGAIAKSLGITTAEAFDQMEKGAISADVGISAILDGMKSFPGAAGAMERQSKTLNGVLSTFRDTLSNTAIDFITPYLPAISRGVVALSGFITKTIVPGLHTLVDGVTSVVRTFKADGLGGVFDGVAARFRAAWPGIQNALGGIARGVGSWIVETAPVIARQLGVWGKAFAEWILPQIPPALQKLGTFLGSVGTWILDVGLPALGQAVQKWGPPFFQWVAANIGPLLLELGQLYLKLEAWILTDALPKIISKLGEWAGAFLGWIAKDVLPGLPGKLLELADNILDWVDKVGVPKLFELGERLGKALMNGIIDGINSLVEALSEKLGEIIPGVDIRDSINKLVHFGGRAGGGSVNRGEPYWVGENRQPELFIPDSAGTIATMGQAAAMVAPAADGGRVYNVQIINPVQEAASESLRALRRIGFEMSAA